MNFSQALDSLKSGNCIVYRTGWTETWLGGSDELPKMFLALQRGYPDGIPINKNTSEATGVVEGQVMVFQPYLILKLPDNSIVPYNATNTDLLAEDWHKVWLG